MDERTEGIIKQMLGLKDEEIPKKFLELYQTYKGLCDKVDALTKASDYAILAIMAGIKVKVAKPAQEEEVEEELEVKVPRHIFTLGDRVKIFRGGKWQGGKFVQYYPDEHAKHGMARVVLDADTVEYRDFNSDGLKPEKKADTKKGD